MSAPDDCVAFIALAPDHAPEAMQEVAPEADHDSMAASPTLTVLGVTASLITGAELTTVTVVDCEELPPLPVHVSPNSVVFCSGPEGCDPLVATRPLQPPEAVQRLAFCAVQLRVADSPLTALEGEAVRVTVGAPGVTDTCAEPDPEPPGPLQVRV